MQNNNIPQQTLEELKQYILTENDIPAITDALMTHAMQVMNSDFASIQLYDAKNGALILLGHKNFQPESAHFWQTVFEGSGTTCGESMKKRTRIMVSDVDQVSYMAGTGDLHSFHFSGIRSCQSTPVVSTGGEFIGMISTHWRMPHDFEKDDFKFFDALTLIAADVLEEKRVAILVER